MLGVSRQTDYAARLVLHLASVTEGRVVPIAGIAAQRQLPVPFVRQLVGRLAKAGIVSCTRGPAGGVRLARSAAEITLLDVVQAIEGPPALNQCVGRSADSGVASTKKAGRSTGGVGCPMGLGCPVQSAWENATRALTDSLAAVRFADLAAERGHRQAHRQNPRQSPLQALATTVSHSSSP